MDIEQSLVSKIVLEKNLKDVIHKIKPNYFYGESREVYKYILDFHSNYKSIPSKEIIKKRFPKYEILDEVDGNIHYCMDELKDKYVYNNLSKVIKEGARKIQEDTFDTLAYLSNAVLNLRVDTQEEDLLWLKHAKRRIRDYKDQERDGIVHIPTAWKRLNGVILGFKPEQLVTVAGRPGIGKTWWLAISALQAWKHGYKVLIVEREMSNGEIAKRLDALLTKIPHDKIIKVELDKDTKKIYFKRLKKLRRNRGSMEEIVITSEGRDLSGIAQKIGEYKPDIVFVDGAYLLADYEGESSTERLYNITRNLKRAAKDFHLPIVITTQMKRGSHAGKGGQDRLALLAGADSFGQDSDVVLELVQPKECKENHMLFLYISKHREGLMGTMIPIRWEFKTMSFDNYETDAESPVTPMEILKMEQAEEVDKAVRNMAERRK